MANDQPNQAAQIRAAADMITVVAEMVVGYHRRLTDGGIPTETAAAMAQEFHTTIMSQLTANSQGVRGRR